MKQSFFIIVLCSVFSSLLSQTPKSILQKFKQADSIVVISHISIWERINLPPDSIKGDRCGLFCNGTLNKSILLQRKQLTFEQRKNLLKVISQPITAPPVEGGCFDPHHALLLYKKGDLSYIHICFSCGSSVASKDLSATFFYYDPLKKFFKSVGLNTELGQHR